MPADRVGLEAVAQKLLPLGATLEHLGTGGFACTFRVSGDGEPYALKLIDPDRSESARVERELSALQRVSHPGVVSFLDHGDIHEDGTEYKWIKMAFVEGHSLSAAMEGGQVFGVEEALVLVRKLVDATSAIWRENTAHRDLSPRNILLTPNDEPVVVDLGLARHVDDETLTELPTPGTPGWMSPEQVRSTPTHGDWRSDQFVIGALGYLFLTRVMPFYAPNLSERWLAPARHTPMPIRALDAAIPSVAADVIERMIEKQPHRRYLRVPDLLGDLDRAILAVHNSEPLPSTDQRFFVHISMTKNFAESGGVAKIAPHGVIIDARAAKRTGEFVEEAKQAEAISVVDPVTHLSRSTEKLRGQNFSKLPYGKGPRLLGFSDDTERDAYCAKVLSYAAGFSPDAIVAPYFFAGEGEGSWLAESLHCAARTKSLPSVPNQPAEIWTGVAVHSSWLSDSSARDALLALITGADIDTLYLLVATSQPSFTPLGEIEVLSGLRDLLSVMREAQVPVVVGRRASSGLLLQALGATGWGTGTQANLMNMFPHPEKSERASQPLPRLYVPGLLNSVAAESFVLMRRQNPDLMSLATPAALELFSRNPDLEELNTGDKILIAQHNLTAQREQSEILASLSQGEKIEKMRSWVSGAIQAYKVLPPPRLTSDGDGFLSAWADVLA